MDNQGDRHRHRKRNWESGASKRRKAKEAITKSEEEMGKIKKIGPVLHCSTSTKTSVRTE